MADAPTTNLDPVITSSDQNEIEIVAVESSDVPAVMLCTYEF